MDTKTIKAFEAPKRNAKSLYPEPFASMMEGREKQVLGNIFGLTNFGVNLTTLKPNAMSSLKHKHETQDEFIFVLKGNPTLITEEGEYELAPNMCAGFPKGGNAHHIINKSNEEAIYLEIGDRSPNDNVIYPDDDIKACLNDEGKWEFSHKNGEAY